MSTYQQRELWDRFFALPAPKRGTRLILHTPECLAYVCARIQRTENGCWWWRGAIDKAKGYGIIGINYEQHRAHVVVYELFVGKIPESLQLDHLCRHSLCVNPEHLETVTSRINTLRGVGASAFNAIKTCCPNGHPYNAENTYRDKNGGRYCRTCQRARARARYHKPRIEAALKGDAL